MAEEEEQPQYAVQELESDCLREMKDYIHAAGIQAFSKYCKSLACTRCTRCSRIISCFSSHSSPELHQLRGKLIGGVLLT